MKIYFQKLKAEISLVLYLLLRSPLLPHPENLSIPKCLSCLCGASQLFLIPDCFLLPCNLNFPQPSLLEFIVQDPTQKASLWWRHFLLPQSELVVLSPMLSLNKFIPLLQLLLHSLINYGVIYLCYLPQREHFERKDDLFCLIFPPAESTVADT